MNTNIARIRIIICGVLCFILSIGSLYAQSYTKQLADGITLRQQVMGQNDSTPPQIINIVEIDPARSGVKINAVIAQDRVMAADATKGRETIGSIAKRLKAAAVVNADFFPFTGDMLNLHITAGELVSEPMPDRMVIGITTDGRCLLDTLGFDGRATLKDGRWIDIRGINRPRGKNEIVAYTRKYSPATGTTEPGAEVVVKLDESVRVGKSIIGVVSEISSPASNTVIPEGAIVLSGSGPSGNPLANWLQPGDQVSIDFKLISKRSGKWDDVTEAVGGGPCLIRDGAIHLGYDEEGFGLAFSTTLHPRTAIGVTGTGKILLATVDGRQTISRGIGLKQLAELLLSKGCIEAANLDGGGSTTMATASGILNSPSEGIERPVANALAVMGNPLIPRESQPQFAIAPISEPVRSGSGVQFSILNTDGSTVDQADLDCIIWSTTGGAGFIDQGGRFYGVKSRKGNVIATLGSVSMSAPVEVVPGAAVKCGAKLDLDPGGAPNRGLLTVTATDANQNIIDGQPVTLKVSGGTADCEALITDAKSKAQTGITWDDAVGVKAYVEVSMQGLQPQILNRSGK